MAESKPTKRYLVKDCNALIDSHAHLDTAEFDADRTEVVARAKAAGVAAVVVPAYRWDRWARVMACCAAWPDFLFPAVGIHPVYGHDLPADWVAQLESQLDRAVAVGEMGLDRGPEAGPLAAQHTVLAAQLGLARRVGLPVILHARQASEELLQFLRPFKQLHGVWHSFSGSLEQAQQAVDLGLYLGLGGAVTHERARRLHRVAAWVPAERLVLETDAPWQGPAGAVGRRNEPAWLVQIVERIAELRGVSSVTLAATTGANARKLFRLPGGGGL